MANPATIVQSDEEMAAAMQEKYRQEFLKRQSRKNRGASSRRRSGSNGASASRVAPVDLDDDERKRQEKADAELARRLAMEEESRGTGTGTHPTAGAASNHFDADAELARRLASQEEAASSSMAMGRPAPPPPSDGLTEDERMARRLHEAEMMRRYGGVAEQAPPPRHSHTPFVASLYGSGMDLDADPDTVAARRVAQELEDEDMARRYGQYEREAAARRQATLVQAAMDRKRRRRKCLVLPLICTVAAIIIVALFATGILDRDKVPGLDDIDWIDPFDGEIDVQTPDAAYAWENKGKGLRLPLLNALDESYQNVYATAIANWDNGDPDALTLTTERIAYEKECSSVEGKLKVCNGDYGATRWRGLNEVLHARRTIYASTAKLNDHYLKGGSEGQKLYTTCHEIGHGFGLPHWDENFYNKDLGNCMDYTDDPEKNATPDQSNFEFLAEVYGTVGARRSLRGLPEEPEAPTASLPQWLMDEYKIARQELETILADNDNSNRGSWRQLSSQRHVESHERDLGEGYTLQVHLLLA